MPKSASYEHTIAIAAASTEAMEAAFARWLAAVGVVEETVVLHKCWLTHPSNGFKFDDAINDARVRCLISKWYYTRQERLKYRSYMNNTVLVYAAIACAFYSAALDQSTRWLLSTSQLERYMRDSKTSVRTELKRLEAGNFITFTTVSDDDPRSARTKPIILTDRQRVRELCDLVTEEATNIAIQEAIDVDVAEGGRSPRPPAAPLARKMGAIRDRAKYTALGYPLGMIKIARQHLDKIAGHQETLMPRRCAAEYHKPRE